jgi:hypothetical protein
LESGFSLPVWDPSAGLAKNNNFQCQDVFGLTL